MSEPPALPEPIKPPRGEFSLEERKWREGITRALNILTEDIANIDSLITKGELSGDSYISVTGGTNAVLGSGTSLSFNDSNLAKLDSNNTFSGSNTFADITCSSVIPTLPTDEIGSSSSAWDHIFTASIGSNTDTLYLFGNGGASATNFYCCPSITATYKYLGSADHIWTEAFISKVNISPGGAHGAYFGSNTYVRDENGNSLALGSTAGIILKLADVNKIVLYSDRFRPAANNTLACGDPQHRWTTVFSINQVDASDRRIKNHIEPLEDALRKLNTIGVKSYTIDCLDYGVLYGLIAQDELERNPELVVVPEDYSEEEGGGELMYMPNNVLFLAVRAIQELSNKVTELEEEYGNLIKNR